MKRIANAKVIFESMEIHYEKEDSYTEMEFMEEVLKEALLKYKWFLETRKEKKPKILFYN